MSEKEFVFTSEIYAADIGKGGAYVIFPYDIREVFGEGRVRVTALFENISYEGSIVNMGLKKEDGSIIYVIGMRKDIRKKLGKNIGDLVNVTIKERN